MLDAISLQDVLVRLASPLLIEIRNGTGGTMKIESTELLAQMEEDRPRLAADVILAGEEAFDSVREVLEEAPGRLEDALGARELDVATYLLARLVRATRAAARLPLRIEVGDGELDHEVVDGDLVVEGNLRYQGQCVVLGDLIVHGRLSDVDEGACLAVASSLCARAVSGEASLLVAGDMAVDLLFAAYESGTLGVNGTLRAKLGIVKNHVWTVRKNDSALFFEFNHDDSLDSPKVRMLAQRVDPRAVIGEAVEYGVGNVDMRVLRELAGAGRPFLEP